MPEKEIPSGDITFVQVSPYQGAPTNGTLTKVIPIPVPWLKTVGEDTPNFHSRKRRGELLPHTTFWQGDLIEFQVQPYSSKTVRNSDNFWWECRNWLGPLNTFWSTSGMSPDLSGTGSLLQQAAGNIMSNGFDALTFMAEWDKTKDMVRNVNRTFANLLGSKRNLARNVHRAWLEGRYGWRTLAYDIRDLDNALRDFDEKRRIWTERSGYSYTTQSSNDLTSLFGTSWGDSHGTRTITDRVSIRAAVGAMVQPSRFQLNPVQTAWELVPLSFVIDWALSVGSAIQATHLSIAASSITSSVGYRIEREIVTTVDSITGPSTHTYTLTTPGKATSKYAIEVRTPTAVPLAPQVTRRLPRPDQILDLTAIVRAKATWGGLKNLR